MSAIDPLIRIEKVTKDYVTEAVVVRALRTVDLTIMPGEFVAIVGTSGSGKSTLMNILGCLDRPTTGSYHLAGIEVGTRSSDGRAIVRNRLIGFIFQGFNLLSRTSALENVELPLQYRGVPVKERRARAKKALEAVGLGDRTDHTPNQLSGGQQQRVAIARALVTDPPLLLADEPTGNLDSRTSFEVLALLQRLNRDLGITIALVTHEPDIAQCASRVITVRDGLIESDVRHEPLDASALLEEVIREAKLRDRAVVAEAPHAVKASRLAIPKALPLFTLMHFILGGILGALYDAAIFGEVGVRIPLFLALLADIVLSSRRFAHLGHRVRSVGRAVDVALVTHASFALIFVLALFLPRLGPSLLVLFPAGPRVIGAALLVTVVSLALRVIALQTPIFGRARP